MRILKFTGATSRDALNQVRALFGDDALIISNRRTENGQIEIVAADPQSVTPNSLAPAVSAPPTASPHAAPLRAPVTPVPSRPVPAAMPVLVPASATVAAEAPAHTAQPVDPEPLPPGAFARRGEAAYRAAAPQQQQAVAIATAPMPAAPPPAKTPAQPAPTDLPQTGLPAPAPVAGPDLAAALASIQGELARRFDGLMWGNELQRSPQRTTLLRELLEAGFSAPLARELLSTAPAELDAHGMRQWMRAALIERLSTPAADQEMLAQPGIYALIGPTGVGKTTTVAKLAARCVELHGRGSLALVTTDSYRVAAHEQLQTFGRIMGVPVFPMRSDADLRSLLQRLNDKKVVLIDNIGLSQRDGNVSRQLALLSQANLPIQRVLVLNAASHGDTLEEVAQVYGSIAQAEDEHATPLHGCIVTKLDEAARIGAALDTAIRHGLTVQYLTDGQKVPENLRLPTAVELIDRALASPASAPALFVPDDAGLAALMNHAVVTQPRPLPLQAQASTAAPLRSTLPWLLHRGDDGHADQAVADFAAGLAWARRNCATRLAHEAWRLWALPSTGLAPAGAAGQATATLIAAQWGQAAQEAAGGHARLLAIHGKASLSPQLPRAHLSGVVMADESGQILGVPMQSLVSQFGHYSIADEGDAPADIPRRRLQWLARQLPQASLVHLFESMTAAQLQSLSTSAAHWMAPAPGALKVQPEDAAFTANETLKGLAAQLSFAPLPGEADGDGESTSWWLGQALVSLRTPGSAAGLDGTSAAPGTPLRLLVLRRATAKTGGDEATPQLILANIPEDQASAVRLAHWYLRGSRLRPAFKSMAPAWFALGQGPEEDGAWLRRALIAGQVGAAAWQAAHDASAAPLRAMMAVTSGWQRQASARHTVEALLRAFALMALDGSSAGSR